MENELNFKKGTLADMDAILALFRRAVAEMDRNDIPQWDEIYPHRTDFTEDIENDTLYLGYCGDELAAVFVLNEVTDEEYKNGIWKYPDSRFAVIHRLCVDPAFQKDGVGRRTVLAAEETARALGYESIRLDAFSRNPYALRMYDKLGYAHVGDAHFRKGLFYLMEKKL